MNQIAFSFDEEPKTPSICECCGAKIVEYKHSFNQSLADSLYKLYEAGGGPININQIGLSPVQWNNFQKLKYWGLVRKAERNDKSHIGGFWELTRIGYEFIEKGFGIYKNVWTFRGKSTKYEGDTVFFNDLHELYIKTRPDYANESKPHKG
jgi:hypothetical protein